MTEPTAPPEHDDDEHEVIDMNDFLREAAAGTGHLYMDYSTGRVRRSGEPITDDPPPTAA